jgi:anti-anti-sigma factor
MDRNAQVTVDTQSRPDGPVVCLAGAIDHVAEPEVLEAFKTAQQCAVDKVFVDVRDVDLMDSTGLRALLIAKRNLDLENKSLRIVAASENVARLIEITGLQDFFPIEGD